MVQTDTPTLAAGAPLSQESDPLPLYLYLAWSIWSLLHGARSETGLNVERRALSLSDIEFLAKSQGPTDHKTDEQTNSSGWKFQASLL